ncbi:MAG: tetratricopeptide repeat protein [Leptolyngbyaceae cyanobacterium SM1_1_3]|nr:tetratricopeptide repeat protein [Leptolyngbyaceae cyanobacterium SM1_1_3]NJO09006.1 tetratricopeptide repeat protein [Leptolyngbyaceae cyanobacterium SL_1_1]
MITTSVPQKFHSGFSACDRSLFNPLYCSVQSLLQLRQYRAALNTIEALLIEGANDEEIWYLRGDALANLSRYREAIDSFEKALSFLSDWPQALVAEAVCWLHLSQPRLALELCDRALEVAPTHAQSWLFKGVACHRLSHIGEAYYCYSQALQYQAD